MRNILIELILFELVIFIGVIMIPFINDLYKQFTPTSPFDDEESYENDIYAPVGEDILDEGFVDDMNSYESRIQDMKEALKASKYPSVEIITEEYEKSLE
jgi:hypothetical protein